MKVWALFAFLLALQAMDVATTLYVLNNGGKEINPVVRKLMKWFGKTSGLIIIKLMALCALFLIALMHGSKMLWLFWGLSVIYSLVVGRNIWICIRLKR